jgi:23S rRNA pseudouridine2605 synthase
MILIKYLAQSGILSRRKCEEAIRKGLVKVNNIVVFDPTYEVNDDAVVYCGGKRVVEHKKIYILLHKPVGYITSKNDPQKRPSVFDLIPPFLAKILDPAGRLDFNTSGILILSNDGDFINSISHPKFIISKRYVITSSRPLNEEIVAIIKKGIKIEEGVIRPDSIVWNEKNPSLITIELHSGKYRVIRRIFEEINIFVSKLHRMALGPLTTHKIPVGGWRYLNDKEVTLLKNYSKKNVVDKKTPE